MTQPVEDVVSAVVTSLLTLSDIEQVPVNPPETVNVATFAIVYAQNGTFDNGVVGAKKGLHNISVDLLTRRTDLAQDIARLKPFIDTIPSLLLGDATLTATVQTYDSISYELITPEYAGVAMIGYKFILNNVKVLE